MKTICLFPGRFQPFHKGHYKVYLWLKNKFGNCTIITTNKVESPKSPFNFLEKKEMMLLTGVPERDIGEVSNPYVASEITQNFNPKETVLVFAVSEKDMEKDPRFSFIKGKYFQEYDGNKKLLPFSENGYIIKVPTFNFELLGKPIKSATEIRKLFVQADEKTQQKIITELYGKYSKKVHQIMNKKIEKPIQLNEIMTNFFYESIDHKQFGPMMDSFVSFASEKLGLKDVPKISFAKDLDEQDQPSFGGYNPETKEIIVSTKNRHIMDTFRTVAHELVHHKQNCDGRIQNVSLEGSTGSDIENEANSEAGKIMRWFAKANPSMFKVGYVTEGNIMEGINDPGLFKAVFLAGGPGCFAPGTKIRTKDGIVPIEEISIGTILEDGNMVTNTFSYNVEKKLIEVYFDDGTSVICTEDHEFLIDGIWIEAKNLILKKRYLSKDEYPDKVYDISVENVYQYTLENGQIVHNSGKDFIMSRTLDGHGLTEINSDVALEFLMKKHNLDMKMPDEEREQRDIVRGMAKNTMRERQRLALAGRKGVIINGTSDDTDKIAKIKQELEKHGYSTKMVFVNTSDKTSKQRNIERGKRGGRTVPEDIRKEKWENVQKSKEDFRKMFGDENFHHIDNEHDLRKADPLTVKKALNDQQKIFNEIRKFTTGPHTNPEAHAWIESEKKKRGITNYKPPKPGTSGGTGRQHQSPSRLQPQSMMDKAKQMGLSYYGFGRFGKNGKVTHNSVNGNLVAKPVNMQEGYENMKSRKLKFRKKLAEKKKYGTTGLGPEFDLFRSPAIVGGLTTVSEDIQKWIKKEETIKKFSEKYGKLAEEKLIETALKLDEIHSNTVNEKKNIEQIRNSINR